MKIHEYQAKEILKSYGVPVPKGGVAETTEEARKIAERNWRKGNRCEGTDPCGWKRKGRRCQNRNLSQRGGEGCQGNHWDDIGHPPDWTGRPVVRKVLVEEGMEIQRGTLFRSGD